MEKNTIKTLLGGTAALAFFAFTANAQTEGCLKTMEGQKDHYTLNFDKTSDGGCVITGAVKKDESHNHYFLTKVAEAGSMEWELKGESLLYNSLNSVKETPDYGYIAAGEKEVEGTGALDAYLVRLDQRGNILWEKTFGGLGFDWAKDVRLTYNGYMIVGTTSEKAGESDILFVKLNQDGELIWKATYDLSSDDEGNALISTEDGGFLITGSTYNKEKEKYEVVVIKTSPEGALKWFKSYDSYGAETGYLIEETSDKGFVISARGNKEDALLKIDPYGELRWSTAIRKDGVKTQAKRSGEEYKIIPSNDVTGLNLPAELPGAISKISSANQITGIHVSPDGTCLLSGCVTGK